MQWKDLSESERFYLAGFADGESSIFVRRSSGAAGRTPTWRLSVSVKNSDYAMLLAYKGAFGGNIVPAPKDSPHAKDVWAWEVGSVVAAQACCEALSPYLRGKRRQAECGASWPIESFAGRSVPIDVRARRDALAREISVLNNSHWHAKREAA